jgi:hypothetical protein
MFALSGESGNLGTFDMIAVATGSALLQTLQLLGSWSSFNKT